MCPKSKIFKGYIDLELKLREFERCRTIFTRFVEFNPSNSSTWIQFAQLERDLGDVERARAIFELAITQQSLHMPELVWKAYIDFEEEEAEEEAGGDYDRPRALYERLLSMTDHVKVWISYAKFEISIPGIEEEQGPANEDEERLPAAAASSIERAGAIFERAYERLESLGQKEERVTLLQAWQSFEGENGEEEDKDRVETLIPRRIKKRKRLADGESFEEYVDWAFPKDKEDAAPKAGRLLELAQQWKMEQGQEEEGL